MCTNAPTRGTTSRALAGLDYEIPQLAQPVFDQLLAALATDSDEESPLRVLDVCCSSL
ncbi:hypothetical protein BH24ACT11_BH24ACT11_16880 [soil metagenome]